MKQSLDCYFCLLNDSIYIYKVNNYGYTNVTSYKS